MNDLIKVRDVLNNIQNQHNKNRAISLVGMVDLN